ncbi:MAG: 30S ribosomal protein S3 [Bacilli bacterium]|jgi:small subunit ribosomal protein S3|nr:30S ribosomal protein S3 [Bacilli bacterium]MCH4228135.1 30S ribosomal protein S3 [Bacilli bacterium]MCH4278155.1 30S ribosomal protein S3 [Bacilli bacterium]MCI2054559.1 30S ribosomal protein S3 [Bacilli bacterium]
MGQKINAVGFRIGVNRGWEANWFASKKDYARFLGEDIAIRKYLEPKLKDAMVSHIDISREKSDNGYKVIVTAYVARPGVVIGQDGANIAAIRKGLGKVVKTGDLRIDVVEVKNPDLDATLIGKWIASELENRQSFRSTQKKAIQRMRKAGAIGCRTQCQGRLGGAEIARREGYKEGVVPLETLRADIDYATVPAATAYGRIGVKVWICRSANSIAKKDDEKGANDVKKAEGGNDNASTKAR